MNDDKLMQAASQLKKDISPERDLWAGIAAAIETPAPRRFSPIWAQAAAIVLLVGASSAITYVTVKDSAPTMVVANPGMVFETASFSNRYTLGPGFQDARNALVAELDTELRKLSPEARAEIEINIELIHQALFDTNEALEDDPDNVLLQERLLKTYQEEIALLRRVSGLTRNVMMRNDI